MIKKIAVLGAGTMGHTIANTFAMAGYPVNLYESFEKVRETVKDKIRGELEFLVQEEYLKAEDVQATLDRITLFADLKEAVEDVDYVIEATPEILELKQNLFKQLDEYCPARTIFASNTSSLKLGDMGALVSEERKAKLMISHWYNPGHLIPIAELSFFGNMSEEDFDEVYDLYIKAGKQPIKILKDITGMVANRLLHAQAREAFYLMEIGAASADDIDKALKFGPCFRNATTGMLEVADMGGLDVWCAAEDNFFPELSHQEKASDALRGHVAKGELGIKTGKGFFEYPEEKRAQAQEAFQKRLVVQLKASKNYM